MPLGSAPDEDWNESRLQRWKAWITAPAQQAFMREHRQADIPGLLLQYGRDEDKKRMLSQLAAHQHIRKKLPGWYGRWSLMLPPRLHLEQASSEAMAALKAQIINPAGGSLVDLTGGTGVDFWQLAQRAGKARLLEPYAPLARLTAYNLSELGLEAPTEIKTAEEWLRQGGPKEDVLYLDPSRRKEGKRQIHLNDYEPSLPSLEDDLIQRGDRVWAKLSPLLDLTWLSRTLKRLHSLHVLAHRNECKEILVELKERPGALVYHAWHLDGRDALQHFERRETPSVALEYDEPQDFIYEPNAALRKAALGDPVAREYGLAKLHPNSQLYTSREAQPAYPGRMWEITAQHTPGQKALRGQKINVVSRNYPLRADQISQKWKLKPHKNRFLLATQSQQKKYWLEGIWRNGPPETK